VLLQQARADAPRGKLWTWMQALPQTIQQRLVAIDPRPAIGEPEQDIGNAAALNDWGQALPERVKRLAKACRADPGKVQAYARLAAWNSGIFHAATGAKSPGGVDAHELLHFACTESA
jgi:hypothetical protein